MIQRRPTPMHDAVTDHDLVPATELGFVTERRSPAIPARTQLQFERQRIRQQFRKQRAALAIALSGELHDEAGEIVTQALFYSNVLRRGLGDDLTHTQAAFFNELDRILATNALEIQLDAAQDLRTLALKAGLPTDAVTTVDALSRWLADRIRR